MTIKNKVLQFIGKYKGELVYTSSSFFNPVIGFLSAFIATAFIDPQDMGVIQALLIIPPYFTLLSLGIFSGLNRNIAFYKSRDEFDKVQSIVDTSYRVATILSGIGFISAFIYTAVTFQKSQSLVTKLSPIILFSTLTFSPMNAHFGVTFRSGQDFKKLGIINYKLTSIYSVVCLTPVILSWAGKILYDTFKPVMRFILLQRNQPIPAKGSFSFLEYKELLKIGFPILLVGYLMQLFNIADQSIIAATLTKVDLGNYTISRLILMMFVLIPTTLSVLFYPKAAASYGKTKSNKGLRSFFWKALMINTLCLVPIAIIIYYLLPFFVTTFLPKYVDGIEVGRIAVFTGLTFVATGPAVIIGVVKKNLPRVIMVTTMLIAFWCLGFYFANDVITIEEVAKLRFKLSFVISCFTLSYAYYLTQLEDFNE